MIDDLLRPLFRVTAAPVKLGLKHKLESTLEDAQEASSEGPTPTMRIEGSPPVRLTGEPSPQQVEDFVTWRSPTYIKPMTDGVADNLAAVVADEADPACMTAAQLHRALLNTPSGYLAERVGDRWELDFRTRALYPHRTITLASVSLGDEEGDVAITDNTGTVHRPGDATFERAVLHTTAWWCTYVTSGLHNWVHFHLPDTMAEAHTRLSNPGGVLARLLAPHVRFTSRINYAGLWLNQSSNNPEDGREATRPWASPPFEPAGFQRGIIENTGTHYADLAAHYAMPESFDLRVPYLAALQAWFPAFERFVQRVDPHIDDADWAELVEGLTVALPGIGDIPRVRVLASFLWQVSVVHGTDHLSFVEHAEPYAFFWPPESLDEPFTVDDVSKTDRWKTLNTFHIFFRYNRNPELDNHLVDVGNYGFGGELADAVADFRADLVAVADDLERRGLVVFRPEDVPQSVCF